MSLNTIFDNGTHKIESSGVISLPEPEFKITKLAFKNRMTQVERIAIRTASQNNPIIFDFLDLVNDAQFIDLSRQDTVEGVNFLESEGLLASGRADEILNAPILDEEKP